MWRGRRRSVRARAGPALFFFSQAQAKAFADGSAVPHPLPGCLGFENPGESRHDIVMPMIYEWKTPFPQQAHMIMGDASAARYSHGWTPYTEMSTLEIAVRSIFSQLSTSTAQRGGTPRLYPYARFRLSAKVHNSRLILRVAPRHPRNVLPIGKHRLASVRESI